MDQKELCDSISKQLDAVSETVYWTLFLTLIFLCAGLTGQDPITFLGMSVSRAYAFFLAVTLLVIANLFVTVQFLRIRDIVLRVSAENLLPTLTKLWTHKWAANPFAFFGKGTLSQVHQTLGLGLLMVIAWSSLASVLSLLKGTTLPSKGNWSVYGSNAIPFLFVLLLVSWSVVVNAANKVFRVVGERVAKCDASLAAEFGKTLRIRQVAHYVGVVLGGLGFILILDGAKGT